MITILYILFTLFNYSTPVDNTVDLTSGSRPGCFGPGLCTMEKPPQGEQASNPATLQLGDGEAMLTIEKTTLSDSVLIASLENETIELNPAFKVIWQPTVGADQQFTPAEFELPVSITETQFSITIPLEP